CGLLEVLRARPARIDTPLLFPARSGKPWHARNFYRDVLEPAQKRSGVDALPHQMRHSWISHMRAARIDPADLAAMSGHTVATATKHYTRALQRSHRAVREAIG
ncbi:MAG: tyrosine-type recombinase/integrase, partial [Solirubrobacteraceae bacterium]